VKPFTDTFEKLLQNLIDEPTTREEVFENFENMFEGKVLNEGCNLALTKRWREIGTLCTLCTFGLVLTKV
jgi:hypothetical protein